MRFVEPLSARDKEQLEKLVRENKVYRVRRRAHTILLSAEGYPIDEIARIYQTDRDTVSSTLRRWELGGIADLYDEPKSGRPPKLSPVEAAEALDTLKEDPRSIKKVQAATKKKRTSKSVNGR